MRIAVLANLKHNAPTWDGMSSDQWDDLDSSKTIDAIIAALESGGHEAAFFEASILPPHNLIEQLTRYQPDLCFNIAESHFGDKFRVIWAPAVVIVPFVLFIVVLLFASRQTWKKFSLVCPHCDKICTGKTRTKDDIQNNSLLSRGRCNYCNKVVFDLADSKEANQQQLLKCCGEVSKTE